MTSSRGHSAEVNILMYHSISERAGPTSIPPATFEMQLETLDQCGYRAVGLGDFANWYDGEKGLPERAVVITFDDGFADFAAEAAPRLAKRGWTATVFLPTGKMGGDENWDGADDPARPLMDWNTVVDLARQGFGFGGHSVSHADLTSLSPDDLSLEVQGARDEIERRLGAAPAHFAPPYGYANEFVRGEIAKCYRTSVGTTLGRASRRSDIFDLPRIEMHYFRDPNRWRAYLQGRSEWYFNTRRILRRIRQVAV